MPVPFDFASGGCTHSVERQEAAQAHRCFHVHHLARRQEMAGILIDIKEHNGVGLLIRYEQIGARGVNGKIGRKISLRVDLIGQREGAIRTYGKYRD